MENSLFWMMIFQILLFIGIKEDFKGFREVDHLDSYQKSENTIDIYLNENYLVILRFSKCMNLIDFNAYKYTFNQNIPLYKLQNNHYWFDMDNPISSHVGKYNVEYTTTKKSV